MKRNLTFLGLGLLISLGTFLLLSNKKGRKQPSPAAQNLVVTQDGRVTVVMQPNRQTTGSFVVWSEEPNSNTNRPSSATTPRNK